MERITIVGAGAWGTALAGVARTAGRAVVLWAHEAAIAAAVNDSHENPVYLPGIALDPAIVATTDPARALDTDAVLLVSPAQFLRPVCRQLAAHWPAGVPAVICAKGIEQESGCLMNEVAAAELGPAMPLLALSGPTFAREVAEGRPTAVTLAGDDEALAMRLRAALATPAFRIYPSDDMIGVEIAGAVKNVLAIASGIVAGEKLGDNARAALVTRGLAEITRLGLALGAQQKTFLGLAGMGDLTLTCNAMQSRNFSFGFQLGEGRAAAEILAERQAVTEGVHTASSVIDLARRLAVDLPICLAVDGIVNHHADVKATIENLLSRPLRDRE